MLRLKKRSTLIAVLIYCLFTIKGQAQKSYAIGASIGRLHYRPNIFIFDNPSFTFGNDLLFRKTKNKSDGWQAYWGNPTFLASIGYQNYNKTALGTALYLMPGLSFDFTKNKTLSFGVLTGLSYFTKKYDRLQNPTNNAIGSNWNNAIEVYLQKKISQNLRLQVDLLHFSTGLRTLPNRGINTVNLKALYTLSHIKPKAKKQTDKPKVDKPKYKKVGGEVGYLLASTEANLPNGPKYALHSIYAGVLFRKSKYFNYALGINYEYSYSRFYFHFNDFSTRRQSNKKAKSTSLFLGSNLHFGNVVAHFRLGVYVPVYSKRKEILYSMIGLRYHFGPKKVKAFVGVALKSHSARAEYMALTTGVNF